jgi:hypothetical protein
MIADLTAANGYRVQLLDELPGTPSPNHFYFPPLGSGGRDGMLIRITPDTDEGWTGCFAFGSYDISAMIASPEPMKLFVISKGAGYVVNAAHPSEWNRVHCDPVRDVRVIEQYGLVLFADFTSIAAYGEKGLAWLSKPLCWDDLKIMSVEGTRIVGCGYDPTNEVRPTGHFELDLLTGEVGRTDFAHMHSSVTNE